MVSAGFTWTNGDEHIWRRLYLEAVSHLALAVGSQYVLIAGEWVDDTELEEALRLSGWMVHAPVRRRRLFGRTSYGSLVAWRILQESIADSERALSPGWSNLYQPDQLYAYILENMNAPISVLPTGNTSIVSQGLVAMFDTDSVEVAIESRFTSHGDAYDLLRVLLDHMRSKGGEQGAIMQVYRHDQG